MCYSTKLKINQSKVLYNISSENLIAVKILYGLLQNKVRQRSEKNLEKSIYYNFYAPNA